MCGFAFAQDSIDPAPKHFPEVLDMPALEDLRGLAGNRLHEMAARRLRARGPKKDGGLLSGWARWLFRGRSLEEFREIGFEIGMLVQYGRDESDPKEKHVLWVQPEDESEI